MREGDFLLPFMGFDRDRARAVSSSLALRGRRADVRAWSIIISLLSLAEILTWILSIADNLAGELRGSREGDSWGFSLSRSLKRYYMR